MKCVRVVGQGAPVRFTDEEAFQIVEHEKDGEYCSKSFWKEWCNDNNGSERSYSRPATSRTRNKERKL